MEATFTSGARLIDQQPQGNKPFLDSDSLLLTWAAKVRLAVSVSFPMSPALADTEIKGAR